MKADTPKQVGFDAAVIRREDDDLNRWPLAREIYGIATTGPKDWSVRIGIYGEWGTGKTSVLEFITALAEHDKQTVVRFNPWQHSSKDALWLAFITAIYSQPIFCSLERAGWVRTKRKFQWLLGKGDVAEGGAAVFSETAGKAVGVGLDIVKGWFSFTEDDLKAVRAKLGDKRVIVLIDDLDRTAPELVPEILFALKELMNIPGFSFICAFDPVVVGQVLGDFHPGFGDGLKFLEKIIDYPRWLPTPPPDGLAKLAIADAKKYCPYVPEAELRNAIELLPPNPRSVRQFIRLLKLLGPQIERHDEDELRWPAILTANVIKILYPRIANALLNDIGFWGDTERLTILDPNDQKEKLTETVTKHVEAVEVSQNANLSASDKAQIVQALLPVCSNISVWFGNGAEVQSYQMNIAESPHAVTGKEFKEFSAAWGRESSAKAAKAWIASHADKVERQPIEVYRELFEHALEHYFQNLGRRDNVQLAVDRAAILEAAHVSIAMLECLVLELGQIETPEKLIRPQELETLFDAFARNLRSQSVANDEFCKRNEELLMQIITRWQGDVTPLVDAILPYAHWGSRRYDGPHAIALHQRLSAAILPRLTAQVIAGVRDAGYMHRIWTHEKGTSQIRGLILAHDGPLWKDARKDVLACLGEAGSNQVIQQNAYELLHWFDLMLNERTGTGDAENLKKLFQEKELLDSLLAAATAKTLSPIATIRLNRFVLSLQKLGNSVTIPSWWEEAIKQIPRPPAEIQPAPVAAPTPAAAPGQTP
jgi:hypothetical protein